MSNNNSIPEILASDFATLRDRANERWREMPAQKKHRRELLLEEIAVWQKAIGIVEQTARDYADDTDSDVAKRPTIRGLLRTAIRECNEARDVARAYFGHKKTWLVNGVCSCRLDDFSKVIKSWDARKKFCGCLPKTRRLILDSTPPLCGNCWERLSPNDPDQE